MLLDLTKTAIGGVQTLYSRNEYHLCVCIQSSERSNHKSYLSFGSPVKCLLIRVCLILDFGVLVICVALWWKPCTQYYFNFVLLFVQCVLSSIIYLPFVIYRSILRFRLCFDGWNVCVCIFVRNDILAMFSDRFRLTLQFCQNEMRHTAII